MSAPLDRLVDTAIQASRSEGLAKDLLLKQFEQRASFIGDQLQVVLGLFRTTTGSLEVRGRRVDKIDNALTFLTKLTPHTIGAARSLASKPV